MLLTRSVGHLRNFVGDLRRVQVSPTHNALYYEVEDRHFVFDVSARRASRIPKPTSNENLEDFSAEVLVDGSIATPDRPLSTVARPCPHASVRWQETTIDCPYPMTKIGGLYRPRAEVRSGSRVGWNDLDRMPGQVLRRKPSGAASRRRRDSSARPDDGAAGVYRVSTRSSRSSDSLSRTVKSLDRSWPDPRSSALLS